MDTGRDRDRVDDRSGFGVWEVRRAGSSIFPRPARGKPSGKHAATRGRIALTERESTFLETGPAKKRRTSDPQE